MKFILINFSAGKRWMIPAAACLLLSGCSTADVRPETPAPMTQAIAAAPESSSASYEKGESDSPRSTDSFPEAKNAFVQYCQLKAEIEAVEIDLDKLEAEYRIGNLAQENFQQQKSTLISQKHMLEQQKDKLKLQALEEVAVPRPQGTNQELAEKSREVEYQNDMLELEEDRLELQYQSGELTREDFIAKLSQVIQKSEELETLEDYLEDILDGTGYD